MSKLTVGVYLCGYNASETLDQALGSVAAQDCPADRVVCVDDGSTDDTADRMRSWQQRLPLSVISHEENLGTGATRRHAVESLDTDVILSIDADDYWFPNHVSTLLPIWRRFGGIVTPVTLRWVPGVGLARKSSSARLPIPKDRQLERLLHSNFIFSGALAARSDIESAGGYRPLRRREDWDLWLRMLSMGMGVAAPKVPTMLYRCWEGNRSTGASAIQYDIQILNEIMAGQCTPGVRRAAERALKGRTARLAVSDSYDKIETDGSWAARKAAMGGLHGPARTSVHALGMILAPRQTASIWRSKRYANWRHLSGPLG